MCARRRTAWSSSRGAQANPRPSRPRRALRPGCDARQRAPGRSTPRVGQRHRRARCAHPHAPVASRDAAPRIPCCRGCATSPCAVASRRSARPVPANDSVRTIGARSAPSRRRPDPRARARRTIKTTKPSLAQRFGAGRPRFRLIATLVVILLVFGAVLAKVGLMQGGGGDVLRTVRCRAVGPHPRAASPARRDIRPQRRRAGVVGAGRHGGGEPAPDRGSRGHRRRARPGC